MEDAYQFNFRRRGILIPMFKTFLLIALCQLTILAYSQRAKCFLPDGTPFHTATGTIKSYMDSLGMAQYHDFVHKETILFFYALSDSLAFAWADSPAEMNSALKFYKHSQYQSSSKFIYDLEDMIEDYEVDTTYILKTIGKPAHISADSKDWVYYNLSLRLTFEDNKLIRAKRVYYNEINKLGLCLIEFSVGGGDYTTDVNISVINSSKKTIKYIHFTLRAFNPVNDIVATKTVKGVGPIYKDDFGRYEFESVFFSKVVDHVKIISIKIEYMDKSTRTITGESINKITDYIEY